MLVTFSCDAHANVLMFGDIAITLLKMMGHSGTVPSALLAEDVPAALNRLQAAIDALKPAKPAGDADDQSVSLSKRALPLISLLTAAAREKADVMWQ